MRRSSHTDDEIAFLLAEAQAGIPVDEICRAAHVSLRTFYRWRKRLGGLTPPGRERLTSLEDENRRLRRQLGYLKTLRDEALRHTMGSLSGGRVRSDFGGAGDKRAPAETPSSGLSVGRYSGLRTGRR